jgi:predicted PurR-regulated permease PerM
LWRVATRTVLFTIGVLLTLYLMYLLRAVMVQVLMAVIVSAGMAPIVDRVAPAIDHKAQAGRRRRQAPRALVVVVLYVLLLGLIGLGGALIIPPAAQQVQDLAANLDEYVAGFRTWVNGLPERYPFVPPGLGQGLPEQLQIGAAQMQQVLGQAVVVLRVVGGFLGGALNFIFILFLALYMTSDSDRIRRWMVRFLAPERRPQAEALLGSMGERLGGWVRGQIMLSAIIGAITLAGLLAIGVPYAVLLSVIAAIGEAVPMVGPIFSAVPAVIVAFFDSPVKGVATLILYIVVQQIENAVVVPKVMERAVSLHPLAVMLALLIGSELYGVAGAILSVPVAAAISVVINEVLREREAHRDAKAGQVGVGGAGDGGGGGAAQRPEMMPSPTQAHAATMAAVDPSVTTTAPIQPPPAITQ